MALNLKELSRQPEALAPGHGLCPGCAEPIIVRQVLQALEGPVVVATATGCLEIATSRYPMTSWRVPWIHSAFENAVTTVEGVAAAFRALVRRGRLEDRDVTFVVFAGDGATYDIGLQWLSGAVERGSKFLYICLNNEAYMNTGIQRSSATVLGAWTTTTPVGRAVVGKPQWRKDLTAVIAAHNLPYAAQAAPHAWKDLMSKVRKGAAAGGPAFINVLAPCPRGWRHDADVTIAMSRLAVDTCLWPLYEVEEGAWTINYTPRRKQPVIEWLKTQGRFSHLLRPENRDLVEQIQQRVDGEWQRLQERAAAFPKRGS